MTSFNRVILAGNLTRDPELRHTASGIPVVNLGLAVNLTYKGKDGGRKEVVSFFTIVTWGRQAEICSEYLKKGRPILVEGRLQSRVWEAPGGQKRTSVEVVASRINFLGRRDEPKSTAAPLEEELTAVESNGNGETPPEETGLEPAATGGKTGDDGIPF